MRLIGLHGEMGAGKDAVAEILVREHGYTQVSVGRHIRRELSDAGWLLGSNKVIPDSVRRLLRVGGRSSRMEALHAKPTSPEIREALIWFGQMWTAGEPNHWISQVMSEIRERQGNKVVWSDIRTRDEYYWCKGEGGDVWHVLRAMTKRQTPYIKAMVNPPALERELTGLAFDVKITNNSSKGALAKRVSDKLVGDWR